MANTNPIYKVTDTELTAVADAIRAKAGITASISYPDGFVNEISKLSIGDKEYTLEDIMYKSITYLEVSEPITLTVVSSYAFASYSLLKSIPIFSSVTNIMPYAFQNCYSLTSVSFPMCRYISEYAFQNCSSLSSISFPLVESIYYSAFQSCSKLTVASFPVCSYIGNSAFYSCTNLMSLYLMSNSVVTTGYNILLATPMSNSTYTGSFGSIYVPSSLADSYKTATNWTAYSARIVGI